MTAFDLDRYLDQCLAAYRYLNQGQVWIPRRPNEPVRIADMDLGWRHNAANFLLRRAGHLAHRYTYGMIRSAGSPIYRDVIGEYRGEPIFSGAVFSEIDLMTENAHDSFEDEQRRILANPEEWLRGTALFRALVAALPEGAEREQIAARARHYSTCPQRTGGQGECTCHLSECAIRNGNPELGCTCRSTTPEWTVS